MVKAVTNPGAMIALPSPRQLRINGADRALVEHWLARSEISDHTRRSNEKEAERFLMWCAVRQLRLSDVTHEDLTGYWTFLTNLEPTGYWMQRTKYRRSDERWRPFAGPLTVPSQRQAQAVILGMLTYAAKCGYLKRDPGETHRALKVHCPEKVVRFLPQSALPYLVQAVNALPAFTVSLARAKARARFLLMLFYGTAARMSDVTTAMMSALRPDERGAWWFTLMGPSGLPARIPVHEEVFEAFIAYRLAFNLPPLALADEQTPLVLTSRGEPHRMTHYAVYNALQRVLKGAASLAEREGNNHLSAQIAKASTYWLRHSSITHQVESGILLPVVKKNARHANIRMTRRYAHDEDDDRHDETLGAFKLPKSR